MNNDRICVSTWSFHNLFTITRYPNAAVPDKDMDVLDFPEIVADRFGVRNIEIVSKHLASTEPSYLAELNSRIAKAKARVINIPIDIAELWDAPSISSPDDTVRNYSLGLYLDWIDRVAPLKPQTVRCDPGVMNLDDLSLTIDSYTKLVAKAKSHGIQLVVENHGIAAAHPEALATVLKATGAGALPDIGNFPDDATRMRGLRAMFPLAKHVCHAKYDPETFDFAKCVEIAKEAGFPGMYSIEAHDDPDPYREVRIIQEQLHANI